MHLRSEGAMRDLFGYLPKSDLQRTAAIMADLLKQPKNQILSALKKGSKLDAYGLIDRDYRPDSVHDYLDWGETLDFDEFVTQPLNEKRPIKILYGSRSSAKFAVGGFCPYCRHERDDVDLFATNTKTSSERRESF